MNVFITGGAGYIGSHTCVELLRTGHQVAVFDNFCNSDLKVFARVEQISGSRPTLYTGDVRDLDTLTNALPDSKATAVIHFAGLKAVADSVQNPLTYYDNNLFGTLCLLRAMGHSKVKQLVFSSSATVYGIPAELPISERHVLSATNPYGQTKQVIEGMLRDLYISDTSWRIAILRYFNPVGAHRSGLIGEDPKGTPNNLMPYLTQVAVGRREYLNVFGTDYATPDGTGVRDYIHVVDLALGHLSALDRLQNHAECEAFNLGTGVGYSVLDVVKAFAIACGKELPYRLAPRRPGDISSYYANPSKAKKWLNWEAKYDLASMCEDSWRWQCYNPLGYV